MDSYSTLTWVVGGSNRCGGDTLLKVTTTQGNGAVSTQAKVEGIVLRAAWHWGSDSSGVNDSFGEPGRNPAVCRPSIRVGIRVQ
jgi:hypothetical protein